MPGPTLTLAIEVDVSVIPDADLGAVMQAVSEAGLAPTLEQIGEVMGEYEQANFATRGATFGQPWQGLAPSTLAEKARHGLPADLLVRSGDLQGEIGRAIAVEGGDVEAGIDTGAVPYALHHQPEELGGDNTGSGPLPARILVAFSGPEVEEIRGMLQDAIEQKTGLTAGISVVVVDGGAD